MKVFTLALFGGDLQPCHYLLNSAKHFGIEVFPYAIPNWIYDGWFTIKIRHMLEALKLVDSEHVLYTDGRDAFFTGPMDEILDKYKSMGSPPLLISAAIKPFNSGWQEHWDDKFYAYYPDTGTPYRFPNNGGYIAERAYIIDIFERMSLYEDKWGSDDAITWHEARLEGWPQYEIDSSCKIFQTCDDGAALPDLEVRNGRLYNKTTDSHPCIFHYNGGFSSPEYGKADRIQPWFDELRLQP